MIDFKMSRRERKLWNLVLIMGLVGLAFVGWMYYSQ